MNGFCLKTACESIISSQVQSNRIIDERTGKYKFQFGELDDNQVLTCTNQPEKHLRLEGPSRKALVIVLHELIENLKPFFTVFTEV